MHGRLAPHTAFVALAFASLALVVGVPAHATDEVHWTMTGPFSVTIDWRGASNALRYGQTSAYGQTAAAVTPDPQPISSTGPWWQAKLDGLAAGIVYHYSIAGGPDHLFRTPAVTEGANFTIAAEADIGSSRTYSRVTAVQDLVALGTPAFVLVIGDISYADDHGQPDVDQHYNDVMAWSQDAGYLPVWGNHEWEDAGDDLRNYKGRFELPNAQASVGAPALGGTGKDWSWFDYGSVRFIAYPEPYPGAWDDWTPRAKALMDQAQADPRIHFIVTFGHRPAYSSGTHPGSPALEAILDGLGDTHSKYVLNLNGHSHNYERTWPQHGVVHVTVGTGGATLEQETGPCPYLGGCPPPAWSAFRAFHHGALKLKFTSTSIRGQEMCGPVGAPGDNQNDIDCTYGDAFDSFLIGADHPPALVVPAGSAIAGAPMDLKVSVRDPDGDPIASLTADLSQLPADSAPRFTVAPGDTTGVLHWTPSKTDKGTYKVTFRAANSLTVTTTTSLDVLDTVEVQPPAVASGFAITGIRPNPTASGFEVALQLASNSPARLELIDPRGRVLMRQDLGSLDPGPHFIRLDRVPEAAPGLYWIRLVQDRRSTAARVTFVR